MVNICSKIYDNVVLDNNKNKKERKEKEIKVDRI